MRQHFDAEALEELAQRIRERGIIPPLIVRPVDGALILVAGERRLRPARTAGLAVAPCRVMELNEEAAAKLQLLENLQRRDLDPIEDGRGL